MATLYACRSQEVRHAISGIITLGTPFIHFRRRDFRPAVRLIAATVTFTKIYLWLSVLGAVCLGWLIAGGLALLIIPEDPAHQRLARLVLSVLTIVAMGVLLFVVGAGYRWITSTDHTRALIAGPIRRLRKWQTRALRKLTPPYDAARDVPMLIVTVRGDEARFWLMLLWRFGDAIHFLHSALSHMSSRLPALVFLIALINFGRTYYRDHWNSFGFHAHYWTYFAHYVIGPMLSLGVFVIGAFIIGALLLACMHFLMAFWPYALRSHRYGYGESSVLDSWLLNIHAVATPGPSENWLHVRMAAPPLIFGRHSHFYTDPKTLEAIAEWIEWRSGSTQQPFATEALPDISSDALAVRFVAWLMLLAMGLWLLMAPGFQWRS